MTGLLTWAALPLLLIGGPALLFGMLWAPQIVPALIWAPVVGAMVLLAVWDSKPKFWTHVLGMAPWAVTVIVIAAIIGATR